MRDQHPVKSSEVLFGCDDCLGPGRLCPIYYTGYVRIRQPVVVGKSDLSRDYGVQALQRTEERLGFTDAAEGEDLSAGNPRKVAFLTGLRVSNIYGLMIGDQDWDCWHTVRKMLAEGSQFLYWKR